MTTQPSPVEIVTAAEHTRQAIHRSINIITTAWPRALNDANARGYPTGIDYTGTSQPENTSVEIAALNPPQAVAWLAELADILEVVYVLKVDENFTSHGIGQRIRLLHGLYLGILNDEHLVRRIIRLANMAANTWPPTPKTGTAVAGVTIGARTTTLEICVYCQQPVTGGSSDPIRRVGLDSDPVHKSPCWYALMTARGQHPRQKGTPNDT